jgi:hypothetical protein
MAEATVVKALAGILKAHWVSMGRSEEIAWPNIIFDTKGAFGKTWVRFSVSFRPTVRELLDGTQGTGSGTKLAGRVFVEVFSPLGNGSSAALTLAEDIGKAYTEVDLEVETGKQPLVLDVYSLNTIGPSNQWWQVNVSVPFEYLLT